MSILCSVSQPRAFWWKRFDSSVALIVNDLRIVGFSEIPSRSGIYWLLLYEGLPIKSFSSKSPAIQRISLSARRDLSSFLIEPFVWMFFHSILSSQIGSTSLSGKFAKSYMQHFILLDPLFKTNIFIFHKYHIMSQYARKKDIVWKWEMWGRLKGWFCFAIRSKYDDKNALHVPNAPRGTAGTSGRLS